MQSKASSAVKWLTRIVCMTIAASSTHRARQVRQSADLAAGTRPVVLT